MSRLQDFYKSKVAGDLQAKFGYKSVMEVPRITKITLNMACRDEDQEGYRRFQDPRKLPDWLHGHAAWSTHVRIPGSPRCGRAASRA
ncbi:hypothetical protein G6F59_017915 [Rhizopus arrhizus]|nr:hypothetical protein G6F59_017915 [Rhizopus arrhizus]